MKTVFFDWGGVIANDPGDEFLAELLKSVGADEKELSRIFDTYMTQFMRGQLSEAQFWNELRQKYGLTIPDTISEEFMKWGGLKANDDVLDLVAELKQQGIKTAVFSNVIEPTYNVLQRSGYYDRFDVVVASCKVGHAKPERAIYRIALDMADATADESIFIDDKQYNLDPANVLGFTTILARNPDQIIRDVRRALAEEPRS